MTVRRAPGLGCDLSTPTGFQAAYLTKVLEIDAWVTGGGLTQIGACVEMK